MTRRSEIFSTLGIAAFAVAAWQDGSIWVSGFCAGAAFAWAFGILFDYLDRRADGEAGDKEA